MKVFAFQYSGCVHEEGMITISLHKTKKGATKAMRKHKAGEKKKWGEYIDRKPEEYRNWFFFGEHEAWFVREIEVQE